MIDFSGNGVPNGDAVSRQTVPNCDIGRKPGATNQAPGPTTTPTWHLFKCLPDTVDARECLKEKRS